MKVPSFLIPSEKTGIFPALREQNLPYFAGERVFACSNYKIFDINFTNLQIITDVKMIP